MGDMRCTVKIHFSWQDYTREVDMNINWCPDSEGVDSRVTEWFAERTQEIESLYAKIRRESERKAREEQQERVDRATYERLKLKYDPS